MKKFIMICSLVLGSTVAHAGAFVEPYVGMTTGKFKEAGSPDADSKGTSLGLRAGYQMVIPWVALDVKMTKGKVETTPEIDMDYTDVGITVGASVPFLRPFIGYIPAAKTKLDFGATSSNFEGSALKLGLGIKILPLVDINIEKVDYTFKEENGLKLTNELKHETLMLGLGMTF